MSKFSHLDSNSAFPDLGNVDVYKFDNQFDYERYDAAQMEILLCSVPWDMGEAHIGNRTIGGIGNVVHFGTKVLRDKWFDDIPDNKCYRQTTKFKQLHRDNILTVEIPFDVASKYNYVEVVYNLFANDNSPVAYETDDGIRHWFWFIREVEFVAPNTTRLHLLIDAFQTFIYDVQIEGMMLERGHAPMLRTSVDTYLANPISHTAYISTPDVSFGEPVISRKNSNFVFNTGDMYAVFVTASNPRGTWGAKANDDWRVPAGLHESDGVLTYYAFAIDVSDVNAFLTNMSNERPQMMQTIQCICYIAKNLVNLGTSFMLFDIQCRFIHNGYKANDLFTLSKSDFDYYSAYREITKLYTWPYAAIHVTDGVDKSWIIHIEDTNGTIEIISSMNLIFPWLAIDSHLRGIGKAAGQVLSFANATEKNFPIAGNWADYLMRHEIPVIGVRQSANGYNDFATHFDRAQARTAADNTYESTIASAGTSKDNVNASAATDNTNAYANAATNKNNQDAIADTLTANATLQQNANTANTNASTARASADSTQTQSYNSTSASYSQTYTGDMAQSTIQADQMQAAISAGATMGHSAVSSVGSILGLDIGGAVTAGFNGMIDSAATFASTGVGVGLTSVQAIYHNAYTGAMAALANTDTSVKTTNAINMVTAQLANTNSLIANTNANSANTTKANATRSQSTEQANADRIESTANDNATRAYNTDAANATRNKNTTLSAINNQIKQARLRSPEDFGSYGDGEHMTTRPLGVFASIITQSDGNIALAGDEMLRYGYTYQRYWAFDGNWTPCKHFTYWKVKDFWIKSLTIPDAYIDRLRFFLMQGVTIWKNPDDIGSVNIYENFND